MDLSAKIVKETLFTNLHEDNLKAFYHYLLTGKYQNDTMPFYLIRLGFSLTNADHPPFFAPFFLAAAEGRAVAW